MQIHIHIHDARRDADIIDRLEHIMSTQSDLATQLNTVTAQVAKIGAETQTLLAKIVELTDAIGTGGDTTPEVDAALLALQEQAAVVDALVPDQTEPV